VAPVGEDRTTLRRLLAESDHGSVLLVDGQNRPQRWITGRDLARETEPIEQTGLPATATVEPHATLRDALDQMVTSTVGCVIVTDGRGSYQGVVDLGAVMKAVDEMRTATQARDRAAAGPTSPSDDDEPEAEPDAEASS
jgi:osmoprotectant transport system ATP-binding protein